jgi:hypothetical protein
LLVPDHRLASLEAARKPLLVAFAAAGVTRIGYTGAFPELDPLVVWLCTRTDEQRDALNPTNPQHARVYQVLIDAGFSEDELRGLGTVAQSQETVDRDYGSSWFQASQ